MSEDWDPEDIPDDDRLFMRVHRQDMESSSKLKPGAFKNRPDKKKDGMSTNWEKYSDAPTTRIEGGKLPIEYAVVVMVVRDIRAIESQTVVHDPIDHRRLATHPELKKVNRSHSLVYGSKDSKTRVLYGRCYKTIIPLDAD